MGDSLLKTSAPLWKRTLIWGQRLLLFGLALYGLAAIIGLLLALIPLNRSYWEFGRMGLWFALLPVPLAFLLAALLRGWRVTLLLSIPLLAWAIHYVPQFMPKNPTAPEGAETFTVLTYNVFTEDEGKEAVLDAILEADADIVALQELSLTVADYLEANLADEYPHAALHGQQWNTYRGQGIFSRFPIVEDEFWIFMDFFRKSHGQQRVVLDVNGQPLIVYNVHPWPPFEWYGGLDFHFSSTPDTAHRTAVERLLAMIDEEDAPLLLLGDLNTSPYYEEYRWISERLTDSYRQAGATLGMTYPACGVGPLGAVIRIDLIFHSAQMTALDAAVLEGCPVSDHHPVWVRMALHP